MTGNTVAVIGLGAMGIVAVKNLLEEGFDVTGFEKSGYVGGLWHCTEDRDTLSVLKGTPPFPSASMVEEYLEAYVDHFHLRPHFRLNATVERIVHVDEKQQWRVDVHGEEARYFDRILMATGPHDYAGKRVLLLGLGNTSGDIAHALVPYAASIRIAHHRGALIMPRLVNGQPVNRLVTQRHINAQGFIERFSPSLVENTLNKKAKEVMTNSFGVPKPEWGLEPAPSMMVTTPVVSDTLIDHLRSGAVASVPGVRRAVGPRQVELVDGEAIEVDVIICCTGYQNDFGILDPRYDPSASQNPHWTAAPGSKGRPLPRLYQNVFSLGKPESLAFMGCVWFPTGAFLLADLTSMSIAQVWKGNSDLPTRDVMQKWVDKQEERMVALAHRGSPIPASVPQRQWLVWANATAGLGVFERLGWGPKGWLFWWQQRDVWRMLMDGVLTSVMWRLFDQRKRKPWAGARAELERLNKEANQ
ncbi:Dimethylaniline monooxygenase [N-oxide-forming]-like protein [Emericellopsis cladophorae]|uniref:Dimethylaniline monooxygenase [N-oxide-forming]-like protein n=1 Tax=Emericellopsis cladophorae TaxID=2686198 RepID=A0A9P9XZG6_9HYPO|nr:Dimethylaniline monooxygenase [N-oxide-forming]-like protein [Emericellopsis cladophorae]KAI6780778.1 Dimethylaniline monooxygenase [N-oxide-forming]-like protein [Emericellopsis cladophorae]